MIACCVIPASKKTFHNKNETKHFPSGISAAIWRRVYIWWILIICIWRWLIENADFRDDRLSHFAWRARELSYRACLTGFSSSSRGFKWMAWKLKTTWTRGKTISREELANPCSRLRTMLMYHQSKRFEAHWWIPGYRTNSIQDELTSERQNN